MDRTFTVVDRGTFLVITEGGTLQPTIATIPPYRDGAEVAARALVDQANRSRELEGALRLLHTCGHAFLTRQNPATWNDLTDAVKVARETLTRSA